MEFGQFIHLGLRHSSLISVTEMLFVHEEQTEGARSAGSMYEREMSESFSCFMC
jgi:hypothetical protein